MMRAFAAAFACVVALASVAAAPAVVLDNPPDPVSVNSGAVSSDEEVVIVVGSRGGGRRVNLGDATSAEPDFASGAPPPLGTRPASSNDSNVAQEARGTSDDDVAYSAVFTAAVQARDAGRLVDAVELMRQLVVKYPTKREAHYLLGALLVHHEVINRSRSRGLPGGCGSSHLCVAFVLQGQTAEALTAVSTALYLDESADPGSRSAGLNNIGFRMYREAVAARSDPASTTSDADWLARSSRVLEMAVEVAPESISALYNLGIVREAQGHGEAASVMYTRVLELDEHHAGALTNLGNIHLSHGHYDEAARLYGLASSSEGDTNRDETEPVDTNRDAALFNMGQALKMAGRVEEAISSLEKSAKAHPRDIEIVWSLLTARRSVCDWSQHGATATDSALMELTMELERRIGLDVPVARDNEARLFTPRAGKTQSMLFLPYDALLMHVPPEWVRVVAEAMPPAIDKIDGGASTAYLEETANEGRSATPLRVAYLSFDFREHTMGHLSLSVLRHHRTGGESARVRSVCYHYGPRDKPAAHEPLDMTSLIALACSDGLSSWHGEPTPAIARHIRASRPNILVDLMGHTTAARLDIVAHKPAPIVVNYLGYPGTTGAKHVDYVIVDAGVSGAEEQAHFSERRVYVPFTYQTKEFSTVRVPWCGAIGGPPPTSRAASVESAACLSVTRARHGLPPQLDVPVLASFNIAEKFEPLAFGMWMALMRRVPRAVLWLMSPKSAEAEVRLRSEAAARGVAPRRIIFAERLPRDAHLSRYQLIDLFVDTHIYTAHSTASDALWAGVPILTCSSPTFHGRVAAHQSMLAGASPTVVYSHKEFVDVGERVLTDRSLLHTLHDRLAAARPHSPIFDPQQLSHDLESAYAAMWELHVGRRQQVGSSVNLPSVEGSPARPNRTNHARGEWKPAGSGRLQLSNLHDGDAAVKLAAIEVIDGEGGDEYWHRVATRQVPSWTRLRAGGRWMERQAKRTRRARPERLRSRALWGHLVVNPRRRVTLPECLQQFLGDGCGQRDAPWLPGEEEWRSHGESLEHRLLLSNDSSDVDRATALLRAKSTVGAAQYVSFALRSNPQNLQAIHMSGALMYLANDFEAAAMRIFHAVSEARAARARYEMAGLPLDNHMQNTTLAHWEANGKAAIQAGIAVIRGRVDTELEQPKDWFLVSRLLREGQGNEPAGMLMWARGVHRDNFLSSGQFVVRDSHTLAPREVDPRPSLAIYCDEYGQAWWPQWGPWALNSTGVGGSEEAVIFMAAELAATGVFKAVDVYADPPPDKIGRRADGVAWYPHASYDVNTPADIFVAWRYHLSTTVAWRSPMRYVWLQDMLPFDRQFTPEYTASITGVFAVSQFHKANLPPYVQPIAHVTPNALHESQFVDGINDPNVLVYSSAPNRGLAEVLRVWPSIHRACPEATLVVYYGFTSTFLEWGQENMNNFDAWLADMKELLKADGVKYVGKVGQEELAAALANAGFLLYPTSYPETGCITVQKAMANGAVPITSRLRHSVLPELTEQWDLGPPAPATIPEGDDEWLVEWAKAVVRAIRRGQNGDPQLAAHRMQMKSWARRELRWARVAEKWVETFNDDLAAQAE